MTEIYKLARPLLTGVRVDVIGGKPYMHGGEQPVPNKMVCDILNDMPQFTGEIVVGVPIDPDCHEMTKLFLNEPDLVAPFIFWVYDMRTTHSYPLKERIEIARPMVDCSHPCIQMVDHELIESQQALEEYKAKVIGENFFTGVVLREPYGTFGTEDETVKADDAPTETVQ